MASILFPPSSPCSKFSVSQNALVSSDSMARSIRPSISSFIIIFLVASLTTVSMLGLITREEASVKQLEEFGVVSNVSFLIVRGLEAVLAIVLVAALSAFCKSLTFLAAIDSAKKKTVEKETRTLKKIEPDSPVNRQYVTEPREGTKQRPPRTWSSASPAKTPQASLLVPVHPSISTKSTRAQGTTWSGIDWSESKKVSPAAITSSAGLLSPSFVSLSQPPTSPVDSRSKPWTKSASPLLKEDISSEEKLEEFLADVEGKMLESSSVKTPANISLMTPPPTLRGVSTISTPTSGQALSSTTKNTPVRTMRISPSPQKFGPSPRKGEGELPPPMSMEQATESFQKLGVYPQIEQWKDQIRQWFSKDLLNPLVSKVDGSHTQVTQAAAKLGLSINVSRIGGTTSDNVGSSQTTDPLTREWACTFSPDEDALLHQLRAYVVQIRDASPTPQPSTFGLQQQPQVRFVNPAIQECLDAVNEHQRLKALMKGEWAKGLLPQSSVRADYTVQRIRELAEGTCVKKYEYMATGELYDKIAKKWTLELPTDSHLLIYLFCALLEHPNWMLHIDATTQPSIQSNNPFFVANLPNKERCPEKYVAVLSSAPSFLHSGACILAVGKQNPPIFALYWDKKLQFSLQGRTALWDAALLLCYRIKTAHGGVVQGINLGSSALNLLSVFEMPEGDVSEC